MKSSRSKTRTKLESSLTNLSGQLSVSNLLFSNRLVVVILPWNFPFWLAFKSVIPPIVMGNSILLKHSPSTPLCAQAIQEAMGEAGFGKGEF